MESLPRHTCIVKGCTAPQKIREHCTRCYKRRWANGGLKPLKGLSLAERFWSDVDKQSADDCWHWTGYKRNEQGYGALHINGTKVRATHVSWFLHHGEWPNDLGLWALHKCDQPSCVNPAHLFLGTAADNNEDAMRKGRSRHVRGEWHYSTKLTVDQVREIRSLVGGGMTYRDAARKFGLSMSGVGHIATRRSWAHVK